MTPDWLISIIWDSTPDRGSDHYIFVFKNENVLEIDLESYYFGIYRKDNEVTPINEVFPDNYVQLKYIILNSSVGQ